MLTSYMLCFLYCCIYKAFQNMEFSAHMQRMNHQCLHLKRLHLACLYTKFNACLIKEYLWASNGSLPFELPEQLATSDTIKYLELKRKLHFKNHFSS